ncbi:MAG: hypothetical protein WBK19_10335 [Azonexus sp.]
MSIIATILSGSKPSIPGISTIYRVEQYRDKPRFEAEAARLKPARPAFVPKCFDHMLNKKVANQLAIEDCLRNGVNTQMGIHLATKISQATICLRLAEMVYSKEASVDKSQRPWTYRMVGDHE